MTDSQIKYQTLMETQRHNLEMERLGRVESEVKQTEAQTNRIKAYSDVGKTIVSGVKATADIFFKPMELGVGIIKSAAALIG